MLPLTPSQYWDREVTAPVTPPDASWMAHRLVREYINERISGRPGGWPLDWFQSRYPRTFERCLSVGCGTGALERDLVRRGIARTVEAFDASPESLRIAQETADAEGVADRIRYSIGDFNSIRLPRRTYDLVCFHQSLHHVSELEHLLDQVRRSLKDDGLLYLDEFVGPSRGDWNDYAIRWYRAMYQLFPRDRRFFESFAMPVQEEDPSEAIRSGDILTRLFIGFDVEEFRGYGGNLLAMLFPDLRVETLDDEMVRTIILAERAMLGSGARDFHAIITARPKRGVIPSIRYRLEGRYPRAANRLRAVRDAIRG